MKLRTFLPVVIAAMVLGVGGFVLAGDAFAGCISGAWGEPCLEDSPSPFPRGPRDEPEPEPEPDPATEAFRTGYRLSNQERYSEAEAYYRQAIALNPRYASAHWNLARVLERQGRYNESVAEMREALRLDPRNTKYKQTLAEWEGYLQKNQEQAERNTRIDAFNAAYDRGKDLYKKNDPRGAEAAFREAVRIFPDDADAHRNLGLILEKQERLVDAIRSYREALRLDPNHSKVRENLRWAEAELQKQEEEKAKREEAQRDAEIFRRMVTDLKEEPGPSEGLSLRIKPFPGMDPHQRHAEVGTSPSIHGLGGMKTAGQQLTGAAALGEGAGREPFDTEGPAGGPLNVLKILGRNPGKAPVVTDEDRRRVPAIVEHEGKRSAARERRTEYEAKLEKLKSLPESEKPRDWSVQVAEANQSISEAGNEEIFYNFQIGKALRKE